jgi:hypothetical protein
MESPVNKNVVPRPLRLKADRHSRLQIPAIIRNMIGVAPGTKFDLHVTDCDGLFFEKVSE